MTCIKKYISIIVRLFFEKQFNTKEMKGNRKERKNLNARKGKEENRNIESSVWIQWAW